MRNLFLRGCEEVFLNFNFHTLKQKSNYDCGDRNDFRKAFGDLARDAALDFGAFRQALVVNEYASVILESDALFAAPEFLLLADDERALFFLYQFWLGGFLHCNHGNLPYSAVGIPAQPSVRSHYS